MLLERSRRIDVPPLDEPSVLDYVDLRNRECLSEWRMRRFELELARRGERREPAGGSAAAALSGAVRKVFSPFLPAERAQ
jgi:hypothetical protein